MNTSEKNLEEHGETSSDSPVKQMRFSSDTKTMPTVIPKKVEEYKPNIDCFIMTPEDKDSESEEFKKLMKRARLTEKKSKKKTQSKNTQSLLQISQPEISNNESKRVRRKKYVMKKKGKKSLKSSKQTGIVLEI